jgi:hypothetical protein
MNRPAFISSTYGIETDRQEILRLKYWATEMRKVAGNYTCDALDDFIGELENQLENEADDRIENLNAGYADWAFDQAREGL